MAVRRGAARIASGVTAWLVPQEHASTLRIVDARINLSLPLLVGGAVSSCGTRRG
jgi:hypothetical protein